MERPRADANPRSDGPVRACRARQFAADRLRPTDVLGSFFIVGVAFVVAGIFAGAAHVVLDWAPGRWLALHLAFVGGVSQFVLGASQFFVGAFLATDQPARSIVRAQLACWNAGTVAVALGVPWRSAALAAVGALALLCGLGLYAAGLRSMQRASLRRGGWAARWYYAAAALFAPGIVAGWLLARGTPWPGGDLLGAHLALNLGGWFGAAIVGTLHTFVPSLTATRLAFPSLERVTFGSWIAGTLALALGHAFGAGELIGGAWFALLLAAGLIGANIAVSLKRAQGPLGLPARLVIVGQLLLGCGLLVAAGAALTGAGAGGSLTGPARSVVAVLLLAGWLGLTVLGSLLQLVSLLLRVRAGVALRPPRPIQDRLLASACGVGVIGFAVAQVGPFDAAIAPTAALLLAGYGTLAGKVVLLTVRAARRARPSL